MARDLTPRRIDAPQEGLWAIRLGGIGTPEVAAAIIRRTRRSPDPAAPSNIQSECNVLEAYIDGRLVSLDAVWLRKGRAIDEREYQFLIDDRKWARTFKPNDPAANPQQRVDLRRVAPILPRRG